MQFIISLALALASISLVIVTAAYAWETHRLVKQSVSQTSIMREQMAAMKKEMSRPVIKELIQKVLTQFIGQLAEEISSIATSLERKAFGDIYCRSLRVEDSRTYDRFMRRCLSDLREKIAYHDECCSKLQVAVDDLHRSVKAQFERERQRLIDEFDAKHPEKPLTDRVIEHLESRVAAHILSNHEELSGYDYGDFWNEFRDRLLALRTEKNVAEKIGKIEALLKEMQIPLEKLRNDLERIRDSYADEYDITMEEFGEYKSARIHVYA